MSVEIRGAVSKVPRLETGWYSFDRAFINARCEIGFPTKASVEIFGPTHSGKSTLAYSISGLIAKHFEANIALADLEGFDSDFLKDVLEDKGFNGHVYVIESASDEEALDSLIEMAKMEEYGVGVLDSVGAISPVSEREGKLGEANMGRRAKLVAQMIRKATHVIRSNPFLLIVTNHVHPNLGWVGTSTPGGKTLEFMTNIRIRIKQKEAWPPKTDQPWGYLIEGYVAKNRYGGKGGKFYLAMIHGRGVHYGLTAMFDCINLGLIERKKTVKSADGKTNFGYLKTLIKSALDKEDEVFASFIELLSSYNQGIKDEDEPTIAD